MTRWRPQKFESGSGPPYRSVVMSSPTAVVTMENPPNDAAPPKTNSLITVSTDSTANTATMVVATIHARAVIWVSSRTSIKKAKSIAVWRRLDSDDATSTLPMVATTCVAKKQASEEPQITVQALSRARS